MASTQTRSTGTATRSKVYATLREAIVGGEYAPGRRLSENELAERLGVSRTPVREALVRLRDDRLVEIVPQLGTFVTRISDSSVNDAQFVREALECAAVRLAAERATRADVRVLDALVARQQDIHDAHRFFVLDDEFHAALCDLSGHGFVWTLSLRAKAHLDRVRHLSLMQPRYLEEMAAEHQLVVQGVRRGDPDAAEDSLRHHLRMVLSAMPEIRDEHPDYFDEA